MLVLLHIHTRPLSLHAAVGQFKELVESSETDQPLQETLKKVLNFTSNGWHKAREHAMRAVSTDNRMRAWCADDSLEDGLLFKCYLGRVDLEAPVGECFNACSRLCLYACMYNFHGRLHCCLWCYWLCTQSSGFLGQSPCSGFAATLLWLCMQRSGCKVNVPLICIRNQN